MTSSFQSQYILIGGKYIYVDHVTTLILTLKKHNDDARKKRFVLSYVQF